MKRKHKVIVVVLATLTLAAVAASVAIAAVTGKPDAWRDERANDLYVQHNFYAEIFTHHSGEKNFKFSYTRPIELWPGHWCVIISADTHSEQVGSLPHTECFDAAKVSQRVRIYAETRGLKICTADRRSGLGFDDTRRNADQDNSCR